jgi:ATP synthase F1 gamma subunit
MSAINELREGLAHTQTAQFVTTMLRDISATKLQSIRAAYEANVQYYAELHHKVSMLQNYIAVNNIGLEQGKKKRVYVALTSNRRFYGTLNADVIKRLRTEVAADGDAATCVIVGQTGRQILQRSPLAAEITYEAFLKDEPTPQEVERVIASLRTNDEVVVIHPTFINAFEQKAKLTDLTHVPDSTTPAVPPLDHIIEPDIPAMIEFFTTQIRFVLFGRIVLETRLALTGARLMKMQRARERAGEMLTEERRVIHKEISTMQSMRLLETFAGFHNKESV